MTDNAGNPATDKQRQMAELKAQSLSCPGCPNARTRLRVVFGEGDTEARVMVVGQGPGVYDEQNGRPFSGPSGALLDQALAEVGFQREQLWLTNVIKCRPVRRDKGRLIDRAPTATEIKACRPWLERELAIVHPRVVVCLGVPAAHALIDKRLKLSEEHGRFYEAEDGTRRIAVFHPAYVLRLRGVDLTAYERTWQALIDDLKHVVEALKA
jgi:uracil-DNA glycosylase family protein